MSYFKLFPSIPYVILRVYITVSIEISISSLYDLFVAEDVMMFYYYFSSFGKLYGYNGINFFSKSVKLQATQGFAMYVVHV